MIKLLDLLPLAKISKIINILSHHGETRLVGGCVRDLLMNEIPSDIDLATSVLPNKVLEILTHNNIKVIINNIEHGVLTAIVDGQTFEIATLRVDLKCDGRRATVKYTDKWQEDALRRDFTINAMSLDINGKVYDYFGGRKDLNDCVVRFIGNPQDRIKEDYLRILRYFRFLAYLEKHHIHQSSLKAAINNIDCLNKLSSARIRQEMVKILGSRFLRYAVKIMLKYDVFSRLGLNEIDRKTVKKMHFSGDPIINLSALIRSTRHPMHCLSNVQSMWKLSNNEYRRLNTLVDQTHNIYLNNIVESKRTLYHIGLNAFIERVELLRVEKPNHDYSELFNLGHNADIPSFPMNEDDIKKMGFEGEDIGIKLNMMRRLWICSDFKLQKKDLEKLLVNYS